MTMLQNLLFVISLFTCIIKSLIEKSNSFRPRPKTNKDWCCKCKALETLTLFWMGCGMPL